LPGDYKGGRSSPLSDSWARSDHQHRWRSPALRAGRVTCAEHARQLGGASPLPNRMEGKGEQPARASPRGAVGRKRCANARAEEQKPDTRRERRASGRVTAKPLSIKGAKRKSGGCARTAVERTLGRSARGPGRGTGRPATGGDPPGQQAATGRVGEGNEPGTPEAAQHQRPVRSPEGGKGSGQ
jgi:hypothetical protein